MEKTLTYVSNMYMYCGKTFVTEMNSPWRMAAKKMLPKAPADANSVTGGRLGEGRGGTCKDTFQHAREMRHGKRRGWVEPYFPTNKCQKADAAPSNMRMPEMTLTAS